ncbi:DEAD/DEAH box helicase [Enterovibrio paralichthyis]|uniref:DEAD/DEAH box helicase n=1 Tax=Enterovibrio paralichthyis TaxID=2853805 RepID=UPI001C44448B|nr:DEAD/DEAH box helicase [Enterovibrio paralichthyis]MBV7296675.1 DEAD/DEAH box helicase [Enterovibrio paralichthyis]
MQFEDLGLDKRLLKTIEHWGFSAPTDVQAAAIPVACAGKDLLASSKTGSGKTLAFLLPAMQRVMRGKALSRQGPRVVMLAPTRELAKQVYGELRKLVAGTQYKAALILGGENFNDQAKEFRNNPVFVVATPGRLADHLEHRHVNIEGLEMLILDEADRMLDLGFAPQLNAINNAASHRRRQTLMFSATLDHQQVNDIAADMLNEPKRVAIGFVNEEHKDIEQRFYLCDHLDHKQALLDRVMEEEQYQQMMVFTATRADTDRLAKVFVERGIKAVALSGELSQSARNRIMNEFERGLHKVLVTTDLASRGLDISNVSHVINFDMPKHAEEYVHRIGRTGRAGNKGVAISFVGPKDWNSFKNIEGFLDKRMNFAIFEGLEGKFKGLKPKPKKTFAKKSSGKKPVKKPAAKKTAPQNRDRSFYKGVSVGEEVFMVKKKKPDAE